MDLIERLRDLVGEQHVVTDPGVTASATVDWTGRFQGATGAVIRPATTDELAAVVACCTAAGAALVPQGGNTGLVGGSVPLHGELVLSTTRLTAIRDVDAAAGQLTAEAGATIATVQAAASRAGWAYGVDWAARDTATVGGSIATNAGGVHVLRHGDTRRQLAGIEAVLADGSIVSHLGGLEKDNTGYDLAGLLCGSEGTLAVITAGRLRLVPRAGERVVALVAFVGLADAVAAAALARRVLSSLVAAELFLADGLALVCQSFDLAAPFAVPAGAYLLLESADSVDRTDELAAVVARFDGVVDVAVATEPARRTALWRYREAHTEAINGLGPPHKLDVTLPGPALAGFLADVAGVVAGVAPAGRTWLFGHAGDGNVHVNVTGVEPGDDAIDDAVLTMVVARGGSISAEHGIGTAKRRWLHLVRSRAELRAMRAVKDALDPNGTLNPHCLLP